MPRPFRPVLAIALAASAVLGCRSLEADRTPFAPPAGQSTLVETVGTREFSLRASGGTGYEWIATSDDPAIATIGEVRRKDLSGPGGYGGRPVGGPMEWSFPVTFHRSGLATLRFRLARPWEKDAPPAEERTVEVTVR
jgi:hypothetical protein